MNKNTTRSTFLTLLFIIVLFQGSSDLYSSSMPAMKSIFHASIMDIQYTITIFLLFYGVGQFIWVYFSEKYDRRLVIYFNLVLFIIASFIASFSFDLKLLYFARALQGIAISALNLNIKAMPLELFNTDGVKKFFAYFALCWGAGGTLAPFIGSGIQHFFGWRYNFVLLAIYAIIMFILSLKTIPKRQANNRGIPSILYDFVVVSKNLGFLSGVLAQACTLSLFLSFNYFMSFFIELNLNKSVIFFGLSSFFVGLSFVLGALSFRKLSKCYDSTKVCFYATILSLATSIILLFTFMFQTQDIYILIALICVVIYFSGYMASENIAITMLYFKDRATVASCIHTALHFVISAMLMFIFSYFQHIGALAFLLFYVVIIILFFASNQFCYNNMPKD